MGQVIVLPYTPRDFQRPIHDALDTHRFSVAVCHRRFGKTVLAVNHLQKGAMTCLKPRPRFAYIAPTFRQGKSVAWDYMKFYAQPVLGHGVNESELRIDYQNGGQMRIYGADNPDSLRGLYFDGVVLDEYGLMQPSIFTEVVRPALADRGGWVLFIGTPAGKNQFYDLIHGTKDWVGAKRDPAWAFVEFKASQTGVLSLSELNAARTVMTKDEYEQEFECSFEASVKGAIYSAEITAARDAGRVTRVPYDPRLPVDTDWDLGIGDAMAIWFTQSLRSGEIHVVDYYEASGEGFPHYAQLLTSKGYSYGSHWAPHDIEVRELSSGKSRREVAKAFGITFKLVPRLTTSVGHEVEEGIHAARLVFPRCWFDAEKCRAGIEALQHYRRDYNMRLQEFKATPVHDWASHAADAWRGLCVRHQIPVEAKLKQAARYPGVRPDGPMSWGV